jgi:hypothetical protein
MKTTLLPVVVQVVVVVVDQDLDLDWSLASGHPILTDTKDKDQELRKVIMKGWPENSNECTRQFDSLIGIIEMRCQ